MAVSMLTQEDSNVQPTSHPKIPLVEALISCHKAHSKDGSLTNRLFALCCWCRLVLRYWLCAWAARGAFGRERLLGFYAGLQQGCTVTTTLGNYWCLAWRVADTNAVFQVSNWSAMPAQDTSRKMCPTCDTLAKQLCKGNIVITMFTFTGTQPFEDAPPSSCS